MRREQQLSSVLSEFARTMLTDFPIQAILDRLVERIVEIMPVSAAGVTLISADTDPRYIAASDGSALRYEQLQTELGEGPCLVAYETGEAVSVPDLRDAATFPRFAPRALEAGLTAVFTFPLRDGEMRLGALDLYRDEPGSLDADTMEAAQTLADVAAAYLRNAQARADLREASDRSTEMALHDALTSLPNRALLLEQLDHAVRGGRRSGALVAVLFADLDRFKLVNDLHGHSVGDELLVQVAERLSAAVRPGDTVARLSGDEFVVLCEDLDTEAEAEAIADRLAAAMAPPFVLADVVVDMTISVGIAFSRWGDKLPGQLLKNADTAMYQAKRQGGSCHRMTDPREQHHAAQGLDLERELRDALEHRELRTDYQPVVRTSDGQLIGLEALLRWDHPTRGLVSPMLVMPLAERSGLDADIGRWVLQETCRVRHRWQQGCPGRLVISVNASAHQVLSPDYAADVEATLTATDTDPALVTLEVTESVFIQDSERARIVLDELKQVGVRVALDNFGIGHSSLSYLKRFPIDVVKIDHLVVADVEGDRTSRAIVLAVIGLAHTLGMTVVAQGVESAAQHQSLAALSCDFCQGHYFARPAGGAAIDAMLQRSAGGAIRLPSIVGAGDRLVGSERASFDQGRIPDSRSPT